MRIIKHMGTRIFWEPLDSPYDDLPAVKFHSQKNKPNFNNMEEQLGYNWCPYDSKLVPCEYRNINKCEYKEGYYAKDLIFRFV